MTRCNTLFRTLVVLIAATSVLAACNSTANTDATTLGKLVINNAWVRTAQRDSNGVAYMTISSTGEADRLLKIRTNVAQTVELHTSMSDNGVMSMRPLENGIELAANGDVELKSGGFHAMLVGLQKDLRAGDTVDLELTFERAGEVVVKAQVRER